MFHVRQKVVCIHHVEISRRNDKCAYPEKGDVYTIRDIFIFRNRPLLRLCELRNPLWIDGEEYGFNARGFRPVIERKTDISVFTEMLTKIKVDA